MTAQMTPFAFDDHLVRTHMDENGDPWFVAKDVCHVLEIKDTSMAVAALDEDEKADTSITGISSNGVEQVRKVLTISESGLYSLIFRSRKPDAKAPQGNMEACYA